MDRSRSVCGRPHHLHCKDIVDECICGFGGTCVYQSRWTEKDIAEANAARAREALAMREPPSDPKLVALRKRLNRCTKPESIVCLLQKIQAHDAGQMSR